MYLYIIASANGLFKIGKTSNISNRVSQIKSASPVKCEVLFTKEYKETAIDLEKKYHAKFESKRVMGEWFALSKSDLLSIVHENKNVCDLLEEMYSWGFFSLGTKELLGNVALAALWQMEALTPSNSALS